MADNKQEKPEEPGATEQKLGDALQLKKMRDACHQKVFETKVAKVKVQATPFRVTLTDTVRGSMVIFSIFQEFVLNRLPVSKDRQYQAVSFKTTGQSSGGGAEFTIEGEALPKSSDVIDLADTIEEACEVARFHNALAQGVSNTQ
jgi:hypothetical protein